MSNDDLPEIPDPLYDLPANKPAAATSPAAAPPAPAAESALAIDVPDMAEMTPPPVKVDPNKDMFTSAVQMAFVGAGQAGNRLAQSFYDRGYRRVCAVNTTGQDLAALTMDENRKLVIGNNRGGAGKDPAQGEAAVRESYEDLMDLFMRCWGEGVEHIWVCAGAGGGTGSGSWPLILNAMHEYAKSTNIEKPIEKRLGVIMTLPKRSEGARVQKNAAEAVKLALAKLENKEISSLVLVDNAKIHDLFPELPVKQFWKTANDNFTGVFHTLNLLAAKNSEYNTFDRSDYRSILQNGLQIFGRTRVSKWNAKEDISTAMRANLKASLLADGFDLSTANMAGAIVVAHDQVLESIPMEYIDYALFSLGRTLGNEGATIHNGIYEGKQPGMQVFTIISGLAAPKDRISELEKLGG